MIIRFPLTITLVSPAIYTKSIILCGWNTPQTMVSQPLDFPCTRTYNCEIIAFRNNKMLPLPGMNQFHQGCKHVIRGHNCLDKQDDIQTPPSLQHHLSTRMLLVTHTLFMSIIPTSVPPNTVVSQGHYIYIF